MPKVRTAAWFGSITGERVGIAPVEGTGIESQRYNWDAPFIISPHSNTRLYFAGHKLYKTDNRGDDWKVISGDLSRGLDRNALPVMGKIWGPDAIAKNQSTCDLNPSPPLVAIQSELTIPAVFRVFAGPPIELLSCVPP